jgi:hypothetical protein
MENGYTHEERGDDGGLEGKEKVLPQILPLHRYFARLREESQAAELTEISSDHADKPVSATAPIAPLPVAIPLRDLATHLPDPERPFWWFSSTPLPDLKLSAGCAVLEPCGTRLPAYADYWCHEGEKDWVVVDHTMRPKPKPKKRQRK